MKKIIFFSLCLIFSFTFTFGQTTSAEYDYVTTKFKIQLDNGLGDKEGYKSQLYKTITITDGTERKVKLYVLLRKVSYYEVEVAAYAAVYELRGTKTYFCIPHPDSDQVLHDKFWKQVITHSWETNRLKTKILARAMSYCDWNY